MVSDIIFLYSNEHQNSLLIGLISGALLAILGGVIQFFLQCSLKAKNLADEVKSIFLYINMVLCLERSSLGNLKKILENFNTGDPARKKLQRFHFTPVAFLITDDNIQKILFFKKLLKNSKHAELIQKITLAESGYRKCIDLINQYNDYLSDEKMSGELRNISSISAASLQDGIILACRESEQFNENVRSSIKSVFTDLFGGKIKLPTVDSEIIKSTDL